MDQNRSDEPVIRAVAMRIGELFPFLEVQLWVPLKELFPKPDEEILARFRRSPSHADIAIFHRGRCVAIVEPGGAHHAGDHRQRVRDGKKDQLCWRNGTNVVRFFNSELVNMRKPAWKKMLRAAIFRRPVLTSRSGTQKETPTHYR